MVKYSTSAVCPLSAKDRVWLFLRSVYTVSPCRWKLLPLFTAFSVVFLLPVRAEACSPLYPFLIYFIFPSSMTGSLIGIIAGILGKCILFAFLVRQINWFRAWGLMLFANMITVLFGFFIVVTSVTPVFIFLFPLVCILATLPSKSLRKRMGDKLPAWLSPSAVAVLLFLAMPLSWILFHASQGAYVSITNYWLLKLTYIYAGLAVGIVMTTLWEEWLFSLFVGIDLETNYLAAVLRTNLYTFLVLAAVGAAHTLPQRLADPNFLL